MDSCTSLAPASRSELMVAKVGDGGDARKKMKVVARKLQSDVTVPVTANEK